MCMWQSQAPCGALSLGGSLPAEFDTCCPRPWPPIADAVAAIATIEALLMKVRRAIILVSLCPKTRRRSSARCYAKDGAPGARPSRSPVSGPAYSDIISPPRGDHENPREAALDLPAKQPGLRDRALRGAARVPPEHAPHYPRLRLLRARGAGARVRRGARQRDRGSALLGPPALLPRCGADLVLDDLAHLGRAPREPARARGERFPPPEEDRALYAEGAGVSIGIERRDRLDRHGAVRPGRRIPPPRRASPRRRLEVRGLHARSARAEIPRGRAGEDQQAAEARGGAARVLGLGDHARAARGARGELAAPRLVRGLAGLAAAGDRHARDRPLRLVGVARVRQLRADLHAAHESRPDPAPRADRLGGRHQQLERQPPRARGARRFRRSPRARGPRALRSMDRLARARARPEAALSGRARARARRSIDRSARGPRARGERRKRLAPRARGGCRSSC